MAELPGMGMTFYQTKDKKTYKILFPEKLLGYSENGGRTVVTYLFRVWDGDGQRLADKRIHLSEELCGEVTPFESSIIACRGLFGLLGSDVNESGFGSFDKKELLESDKADDNSCKWAVLSYLKERYDSLWDEPITILEVFAASVAPPTMVSKWVSRWVLEHYIDWDLKANLRDLKERPQDYLGTRLFLIAEKIEIIKLLLASNTSTGSMNMKIQLLNHRHYKIVDIDPKLEKGFAFIIMPFNQSEFDQSIMAEVFQPTVEEILSIPCVRSDSETITHILDNLIYTYIVQSDVVLADLSTQNRNVVFELGLALGLQKDVIALFDKRSSKEPAFDYGHYGAILYDDYEDLKAQLRKKLPTFKKAPGGRNL